VSARADNLAESDRPSIRLVGAAEGDPYSPGTLSGSARFLLDALERRYDLVQRVDYRLYDWRRGIAALGTFRLPRRRWAHRYHRSRVTLSLRSRRLRSQLAAVKEPYDLVVQLFGWFQPHEHPYVCFVDTTWHTVREQWAPWLPSRRRRALAYWLDADRRMFGRAKHIFVSNRQAAESLLGFYDVPATGVSIVGGGANFSSLPELGDLRQRDPIILFVGREFVRKGGDCLLEAFRHVRQGIPNARLVMVGCRGVANEGGVAVLGERGRSALESLYKQAKVFCLPSRYDPFPNVLAEAMAHGLPCVATTAGGIPEVVGEGETGFLVPPDDEISLARALLRLLREPDMAVSLGAAGRRRVEAELNWDAVAERMGPGLTRAARLVD
jgi:alpha-maltose-1-phosphate synthase